MMNQVLKFDQNYTLDESIISQEVYGFNVITGTQLNNPGTITIQIQNTDNFYYPAESYLEFEGILEKTPTGSFTKTDLITFTNNGVLFLFDNIKYLLSSAEIESVFNPGTASDIIGLARYPAGFEKGLMQGWAHDTSGKAEATNVGYSKRHTLFLGNDSTVAGSFRISIS